MSAPEAVRDDAVVSIHYKLSLEGGQVVDSSAEGEPLDYLHGHGNIVPGLESKISGRKVGDRFNVEVAPSDGYGDHDPSNVMKAPRSAFPDEVELEPGMQFQTRDDRGNPSVVLVTEVADEEVTVDMNHPLAGQTLFFEIEVADIRVATANELEHGHVHGADDHHH